MGKNIEKIIKNLTSKYWLAKSRYIHYYDKYAIDEKAILLESQHGHEFNGNIFALAKYLSSDIKYADFSIYLSCNSNFTEEFEEKINYYNLDNIKIVTTSTKEYFKALASAKYLINDNTFLPYFIKKEGQIYLNTWHGTPLKSLGRKIKHDALNIGNPQRNFLTADYILFPNEYTKRHMLEDYMMDNIAQSKTIMGGYPRNDVFFNTERRKTLRKELKLENYKVWAYMPTFRQNARVGTSAKSDAYMLYNLFELDKRMNDDEVMFVNLHPVSRSNVDFDEFIHIKEFPSEIETYDFLNITDCLVTDYSSVFFDYACTGKKIILFTYDKEDYLKDRGMYLSLDDIVYPKVGDFNALLKELRFGKNYDDRDFIKDFIPFESAFSSQKLCDQVILNEDCSLPVDNIHGNGKKNILLYAGNLAPNGVTASLRNLLCVADTDKYNFYISFHQNAAKNYGENLFTFPSDVSYLATVGGFNLTVFDRIIKVLFRFKIIRVGLYMKINGKRVKQNFERDFGFAKFDTFIQFSGYVPDQILKFTQTDKNNVIYVHSDMEQEIKQRGNQRADVLKYAYKRYKHVAAVSEDIVESTLRLGASKENACVIKNIIAKDTVLAKSKLAPQLDEFTESSVEHEEAMKFITDKSTKKFIAVGRFSPEKGHKRLVCAFEEFSKKAPDARLIIMGGSSYLDEYDKLLDFILQRNLQDRVLLLMNVSNPFAVMKQCDYSILSSYYEGFGLAVVEADIVGLSVVSTDITGPRGFMKKYGGSLVENSQKGIENGFEMLYNNEVKRLNVDYDEYNREALEEFESVI